MLNGLNRVNSLVFGQDLRYQKLVNNLHKIGLSRTIPGTVGFMDKLKNNGMLNALV